MVESKKPGYEEFRKLIDDLDICQEYFRLKVEYKEKERELEYTQTKLEQSRENEKRLHEDLRDHINRHNKSIDDHNEMIMKMNQTAAERELLILKLQQQLIEKK